MRQMRRNLLWGVEVGGIGGVLYGLAALGVIGLKGWPDMGIHPLLLFLLYVLAGLVVGGTVGLLRPLLTTRRRAALAGPLAGIPGILVLAPAPLGPISAWGGTEWFTIVFVGTLFGVMFGWMWWEPPPQPDDPASRPPLTRRERKRRNREARRR